MTTHPFLDLAPLTAAHFASIEDRVARLLSTEQDVVIMQGEALLPLEGAIRGTAGPGTTALNMVTGPYGQTFGDWLRDCGATVDRPRGALPRGGHGRAGAGGVRRASGDRLRLAGARGGGDRQHQPGRGDR